MSDLKQETEFKLQEIGSPSAFEGALWAAMGIKNGRILFHSPPGCYINQHVNALINDWAIEMYTTNLSYGNIMQGAEDKMEDALRKTIKRNPEAVFIVAAPTVEVTKDDIEGVVKKVGFKDTVIIHPPIGGSSADGKDEAFIRILDLVEPAKEKKKKSVNIIGPTFSTFNWRADVYELKRMLREIGVEVNTVFTAGATVAEIKRAAQAELNVCIYPYDCGIRTAQEMEKRFGIPYMDDIIPIGFTNSAEWLNKIADFFKIDAKPFLKKAIDNSFEFICSNMVFALTFEMTAALSLENHNTYGVGLSEFLTKEVGTTVVLASVTNPAAADRLKAVCDDVLLCPTIDTKKEKYVEKGPMVIYGNFYDKKVSMDEGFKNFIFSDILSIGYLSTENCPFMGFMGAKYIVESLVNQVYMGIFLETKGEMMGPISTGAVPWDIEAEQAMIKIGEMIPHFIRTTATKKLHSVAEQYAKERGSKVTLQIMQEVADKYTPTKFKAKFSSVFGDEPAQQEEQDEEVPIESLTFTMPWDDDAKKALELVPSPFRQAAVSGTEDFAKGKSRDRVSAATVDEFRKELGM